MDLKLSVENIKFVLLYCHQREKKKERKDLGQYIVGVVRKTGWYSPVMYEGQIFWELFVDSSSFKAVL